ncbi:MAG: PEGA domain-containing protein [Myxococcota bacterium]
MSALRAALAAAVSAALAGPALAGDEAPAPDKTKVLVLPYQAIYRSVPQKKLNSATELLFKELERKDDVAIVRGAVSSKVEGPNLDAARTVMAEAEAAEKARNIDVAIGLWQKALATFEANAGAITDCEEFVALHHRLARALMLAGKDKEAQDALARAARMIPSIELPPNEFPKLYRKWFRSAVQVALSEKPGQVLVQSALPGAKVSLDGRPMEVAPVLLDKVVPGRHSLLVQIPEVAPFGAVITVNSGQKLEVRATFLNTMGGSSVGKVTDAIAENGIPKPAVESAAAAGKESGAAFVILGAMAKDEDKFRVHTFIVDVGTQKIHALEPAAFDLEMLTAETDVLRIVNAAHDTFSKFPGTAGEISLVEKRIKAQSNITTIDATPEYADASQAQKSVKKANGPRTVFKPLKSGAVKAKDEED